jgi:hypothetical protein
MSSSQQGSGKWNTSPHFFLCSGEPNENAVDRTDGSYPTACLLLPGPAYWSGGQPAQLEKLGWQGGYFEGKPLVFSQLQASAHAIIYFLKYLWVNCGFAKRPYRRIPMPLFPIPSRTPGSKASSLPDRRQCARCADRC